jgi:hypothetical protein
VRRLARRVRYHPCEVEAVALVRRASTEIQTSIVASCELSARNWTSVRR